MNLVQKIAALPDALSGYLFVDPARNGEYRFARSYIKEGMVVFDVGANIGDYSHYLLGLARGLRIHCFEPVEATFATLQRSLQTPVSLGQVVLNRSAVGEKAGLAQIFVYKENAGSNSLYFHDYHAGQSGSLRKEEVIVTTIDSYVDTVGIDRIALMKIDVEGHEVCVIRGAEQSLRDSRITCIQFEYNNYWQRSGRTLLEMLDLLRGLNDFAFYRITPWGKWRILRFHSRLETFKQSNYLAVLKANLKTGH